MGLLVLVLMFVLISCNYNCMKLRRVTSVSVGVDESGCEEEEEAAIGEERQGG